MKFDTLVWHKKQKLQCFEPRLQIIHEIPCFKEGPKLVVFSVVVAISECDKNELFS